MNVALVSKHDQVRVTAVVEVKVDYCLCQAGIGVVLHINLADELLLSVLEVYLVDKELTCLA